MPDDNSPTKRHCLIRTSPLGTKFVGTCAMCGKEGLTLDAIWTEECDSPRGETFGDALQGAIEGQ